MTKRRPKLSKNDLAFIAFVKSECKRTGITCRITYGRFLWQPDGQCTGYFDEDNRILACALGRKYAIGTLAHEYCHLLQWEEKCPIWKKAIKLKAYEKFADWMGDRKTPGKEVKGIIQALNVVRDLELDNEKRTVAMIKKHKLSVDLGWYVQAANAYVHFYNYIKKSRKWSKSENSPYTNDVLRSRMSKKFNMNYTRLEPWIEQIFREQKI